jgi:hypothetical protein
MDSIDKEEFMDRMYRRLEEKDQFVSLDDYESELNELQD